MSPDFSAEIYLLTTEVGGRTTPLTPGDWRTVLCINNEHWSARLLFSGTHSPGETFPVAVQLLMPEAIQYFPIGAEFTVWEGGTRGHGRVLSSAA
jgi:translation elongation factor EF-Tu-like GTPase